MRSQTTAHQLVPALVVAAPPSPPRSRKWTCTVPEPHAEAPLRHHLARAVHQHGHHGRLRGDGEHERPLLERTQRVVAAARPLREDDDALPRRHLLRRALVALERRLPVVARQEDDARRLGAPAEQRDASAAPTSRRRCSAAAPTRWRTRRTSSRGCARTPRRGRAGSARDCGRRASTPAATHDQAAPRCACTTAPRRAPPRRARAGGRR